MIVSFTMLSCRGMRSIPLRLWLLSLCSAVLQCLPFPLAGPVPAWRRLFCWICLTPLLFALSGRTKKGDRLSTKQAALLAYACGIVWYLGNCYWIYQTMHLYGNLPEIVAAGILILFAFYLGLYHALFGAIFGFLRKKLSVEFALLLVPITWVAVELARARITGFPWDLLGYTQVDNLFLTRMAPWTGVMGISFVIAVMNALLALLFAARDRKLAIGAGSAAVVVAAGIMLAGRVLHPSPALATGQAVLLQDNLSVGAAAVGPQESRSQLLASLVGWTEHPRVEVIDGDKRTYLSAPPGTHPDLVLWPEAPADFIDGDPLFRQTLSALALQQRAPLISDSVAVLYSQQPSQLPTEFNSASFFAADGTYSGRYDKIHLVPFGEYTPYRQLFFFAGHLLDNVGGFTKGTARNPFATGGHSYGVFICYESIFGNEVRQFVKNGADVLVNLSDDGWYGDSSAPWEHLDMARMRAIENDRWLLRSTNTGVTTVIDPHGRLGPQLPRHVRSSLLAPFGYERTLTFYTRHGDWIAWLCAALTLCALALAALVGRWPAQASQP